MIKMILPIFIGLALLGGCQNSEPETKKSEKEVTEQKQETKKTSEIATNFPYPNLLSESDETFFLLVIGEQDDENPIEKNKKIAVDVNGILSLPTLEMAQQAYPDLNIKIEPSYLLFDDSKLLFQANNLKDLITYFEKKTIK